MEELLRDVDLGMPVIVEGKKDREALLKLGFQNIHTLKQPLFEVAEKFQNEEEVMILTDLDAEGRRLYRKLKRDLSRIGVTVNDRFRNHLFKETPLSHIEGLATFVKNMEKKGLRH